MLAGWRDLSAAACDCSSGASALLIDNVFNALNSFE